MQDNIGSVQGFQQNLLYIFKSSYLLYINVQKYKQRCSNWLFSPEASQTQRCYWASPQEHGAAAAQAGNRETAAVNDQDSFARGEKEEGSHSAGGWQHTEH
jgi:hypothetical protein